MATNGTIPNTPSAATHAPAPTAVEAAVRSDAAPLSEDQALDWLRVRGRVTMSNAELGRQWGWHRQRVARRLDAWAEEGLIKRRVDTVTALTPESVTDAASEAVTKGVTNASLRV
jgi:hypothetical protein